jgi:uncharacterized protein (UPF0332 family)
MQLSLYTLPGYCPSSLHMLYCCIAMSELEDSNREAVLVYINGAREALESAQYNLDGGFYGVAANRAYYAFFYAATALLLTLDITRSRHAGVLAAFREHFVRPGKFPVQDSHTYGEAFELRNVTDYEMLGHADSDQAQAIVEKANRFVERCRTYLAAERYL